MALNQRTVVVVGASLAGFRAAEELRHQGFDGRLVLVGDEPHRPYDRPPLSKQVLAGARPPEAADLPGTDDLDAEWVLGRRATALDVRGRRVTLDDGTAVAFDGCVVATGATPRRLPGWPDAAGVHVLRTLDDCAALRADLAADPGRIVVVGAGFIGAEVAATARGLGVEVTLLEALPVPLVRALGEAMGAVCADLHRDHGVDLRLGTGVDGIAVDGDGRVAAVDLAGGGRVEAGVVVVGVGVRPNTDWLAGSGLEVGDGVVCDETCLAAPGVVAAGDVARWPNRRFDEVMRVEHWDNAQEQGGHAARTLLADQERAGDTGTPFQRVTSFRDGFFNGLDQCATYLDGGAPAEDSPVAQGD